MSIATDIKLFIAEEFNRERSKLVAVDQEGRSHQWHVRILFLTNGFGSLAGSGYNGCWGSIPSTTLPCRAYRAVDLVPWHGLAIYTPARGY